MDPDLPHAPAAAAVFSALLCGKNGSSEMTHEGRQLRIQDVAELHAEGRVLVGAQRAVDEDPVVDADPLIDILAERRDWLRGLAVGRNDAAAERARAAV